jgi:hypothetical protein
LTRCLLICTTRTYFRGVTSVKEAVRNEESEEQSESRDRRIQSAWERKRIGRIENSERDSREDF